MKAVIFDRDGVIIDSESMNIDTAVEVFKKLNIIITEEEKKWITGKHPIDYTRLFLEKYQFSVDEFRSIQREIFGEKLKSAPLFDKTIFLIKELHELKIPLALTTSSKLQPTLEVLKRAGLENVFKTVVAFEDYEKRKPDPEPYIITAQRLNLNPEDCIAIEDSDVGVESAKKAGMKCIAMPNKHTKNQDLSKADIIVDSADKITMDLLNNM